MIATGGPRAAIVARERTPSVTGEEQEVSW
jgi:hypothetical protein